MVRKMSLSAMLLLGGALFLSACFPALPSSSSSAISSSSSSVVESSSVISSSSSESSSVISSSSSESSSVISSSSSVELVVVDIGLFDESGELVTTMTQDEIDDDYVVNLIYDDGSLVPIEFYTIEWDGLDIEAPVEGDYTVVITYLAFTHEVAVQIDTTALLGIQLVDQLGEPLTSITIGEQKEVIVEAVYADGSIIEIPEESFTVEWDGFDPETMVPGTYNVVVTYQTFTADLTIIVPEVINLGIMVDASAIHPVIIGETTLDLSPLHVYLVQMNGSMVEIPFGGEGYDIPELATFDPTVPGSYVFTVHYQTYEPETFEVIVIDPDAQGELRVDFSDVQTVWPINSPEISLEGLRVYFTQSEVTIELTPGEYTMQGTIDPTIPGEYPVYAVYNGYQSGPIVIHIVSDIGEPVDFFIDTRGIPAGIDEVIYDFDLVLDVLMFRLQLDSGIAIPVNPSLVTTRVLTTGGVEYVPGVDEFGNVLPVPYADYTIEAVYTDEEGVLWTDDWVITVRDPMIEQVGVRVEYNQVEIVIPYGSDFNPNEIFQKDISVFRDYEDLTSVQIWDFYIDWDPDFDPFVPGDYVFTLHDGLFSDTFIITVATEEPSTAISSIWVNDNKAQPGELPAHYDALISSSAMSAYIEIMVIYSGATFDVYDDAALIFSGDNYDNAFEVILGELTTSKSLAIHMFDGTTTTIYHLLIEKASSDFSLVINGDPVVFDEWDSGFALVGREMDSFSFAITMDSAYTFEASLNGMMVMGPTVLLDEGPFNYFDVTVYNGDDEVGYYSVNIRRDPIIEGFLVNGVLYENVMYDGITYEIELTTYVDEFTIVPVYEAGVDLTPYTFHLMNHLEMQEITGPFPAIIGDYFLMADLTLRSSFEPVEFYDIHLSYAPEVDLWTSFTINGDAIGDIPDYWGIPANDLMVDVSYTYDAAYTLTVYDPGMNALTDVATGFFAPVFGGENNYMLALSNGTETYRYALSIMRNSAWLSDGIDSITVLGQPVMLDYWGTDLGHVKVLAGTDVLTSDFVVTLSAWSIIDNFDIMKMSPNQFMIVCYDATDTLIGYYSVAIIFTPADALESISFDFNDWFIQTSPTSYAIYGIDLIGEPNLTEYDFYIEVFDPTATISYDGQTVISGEPLFVTAALGQNTYVVDVTVNGVIKTYTFVVNVSDYSKPMFDIGVDYQWYSWSSTMSDFTFDPMNNRYLADYPVVLSTAPLTVDVYVESLDGETAIDNDSDPLNGVLPFDTIFTLPVEVEGNHYWVDFYTVIDGDYFYTIVPIFVESSVVPS